MCAASHGAQIRGEVFSEWTAHQVGTVRFSRDPITSVLDIKAHELDNLYVTDASFFRLLVRSIPPHYHCKCPSGRGHN